MGTPMGTPMGTSMGTPMGTPTVIPTATLAEQDNCSASNPIQPIDFPVSTQLTSSINSYTIVTTHDGEVTLHPVVLTPVPVPNSATPVSNSTRVPPRKLIAIAPKPANTSVQLDGAVSENLTGLPFFSFFYN